MKKIILLPVLFLGMLLVGCFHEDDIHVEEQHYERMYDTTSTDPVWKHVSQYYYKYGKLLITDVEISDYVFNFNSKYALWLLQADQDQEHLLRGIQFVEEMFLNGYDDDFKRKLFPLKVLLADSVVYTGSLEVGKEWQPIDMYATENHISFSISEHMMSMTEEEKEALSANWNYQFVMNYCEKKTGWTVPEDFYLYPTDDDFYKNFKVLTSETWVGDNFWELGYPSGKVFESYIQGPDGKWGFYPAGYQFPSSKSGYLEDFVRFLFTTPLETINRAVATYPKLKKAHDVLDQSLKDDLGIDYRKIGYKSGK